MAVWVLMMSLQWTLASPKLACKKCVHSQLGCIHCSEHCSTPNMDLGFIHYWCHPSCDARNVFSHSLGVFTAVNIVPCQAWTWALFITSVTQAVMQGMCSLTAWLYSLQWTLFLSSMKLGNCHFYTWSIVLFCFIIIISFTYILSMHAHRYCSSLWFSIFFFW